MSFMTKTSAIMTLEECVGARDTAIADLQKKFDQLQKKFDQFQQLSTIVEERSLCLFPQDFVRNMCMCIVDEPFQTSCDHIFCKEFS